MGIYYLYCAESIRSIMEAIYLITPEMIETLIAAIVALITAILAIIKAQQANIAQNQVKALTPDTPQASTPAIVATLPARSWKMDDSTRRWLTFDASPANLVKINQQIDAAEAQHLTQYQIIFDGGYYNIEYGLLKGGAGNPSGK